MPVKPRGASATTGDAVAASIEHPSLRDLYAYWESKMAGGRLPRLADLDPPMEIPRLTAAMSIVLVESEPLRFKYKRMGSAIVADRKHRKVRDATGRYLDEIDFHTPIEEVLGPLAAVARSAQPYRELGRYAAGDYAKLRFEWIILPMSEDGERVTALITGYVTLMDKK